MCTCLEKVLWESLNQSLCYLLTETVSWICRGLHAEDRRHVLEETERFINVKHQQTFQ